ncbi:MAG: GNAT family N-acetyltransferase [Ruminococcus flavefaciens]|nr:GNAT family N-acetyltransferase [Ruminococcus flavefaciens]
MKKSWKSGYKGILPQDYLESIPVGRWAESVNRNGMHNLVAIENGHIIGTCGFCRSRWEKYSDYGEIVSVYFLPEYTGKGLGKCLLDRAVEELEKMGYKSIILWVLEENFKARRFYEKNGFIFSGEYMENIIGGKEVQEVMYIKR